MLRPYRRGRGRKTSARGSVDAAPERMVGRDLDEAQFEAVGILDPALDQSPRHAFGGFAEPDSGCEEARRFVCEVLDLQPDAHPFGRRFRAADREFEESAAEEID